MRKITTLLPLIFAFAACNTTENDKGSSPGYTSQMQPDGNTWIVRYGSDKPWNGCNFAPETHEKCATQALQEISRIGKETCGLAPNQIFGCERLAPGTYIACKLECKPNPRTRNQPRWVTPRQAPAPILGPQIQSPQIPTGQPTPQQPSGQKFVPQKPAIQPGPATPQGPAKSSIFQRAKKCAERGGVWVNDSCQIDIDE